MVSNAQASRTKRLRTSQLWRGARHNWLRMRIRCKRETQRDISTRCQWHIVLWAICDSGAPQVCNVMLLGFNKLPVVLTITKAKQAKHVISNVTTHRAAYLGPQLAAAAREAACWEWLSVQWLLWFGLTSEGGSSTMQGGWKDARSP